MPVENQTVRLSIRLSFINCYFLNII